MNKIRAIKKRVKEILLISTCHGVQNILITERTIIKFLWIFSLLISTGYCIYMISFSITDFLNYNVNTQISVSYEMVSRFPTVTFCSDYSFKVSQDIIKCNFNKGYLLKKKSFENRQLLTQPIYAYLCIFSQSSRH
jgi:hypothetical protein